MGLLKNIVDSIFFAALFYIGLGFMAVVHGHQIPTIAFGDLGIVTAIIYFFVMVVNYRL